MLAATGRPAVKAVAPLYDDYDAPMDLAMPGGVLLQGFLAEWGKGNNGLDANDYCALTGAKGFGCFVQGLFIKGIKPVDADRDGRMLDSIVRARRNYDVLTEIARLENPRDTFPTSGLTFADVSPYGMRAKVEPLATPMLVRVGWLDAGTVNVALGASSHSRFRSASRSGRGATAASITSIHFSPTRRRRRRRRRSSRRRWSPSSMDC